MFDLTEEQRMVVRSIRQLAEAEFARDAFTWEGAFPAANVQTLADHGFLGLNIAEEYGGGGMTEFEVLLEIETVGRICPDTASAIYGQSMVAPRAIEMFGSESLKEEWLPRVTEGDAKLAIAMSEPEAGSDSKNMHTHVEEDGGEWYLSGEKTWVSDVPDSDGAVVWTKFPDGNLGSVFVEFEDPGIEVQQHYTNMHGGTQTHFYLDDVHVLDDHILVWGRDALHEQLKALNWERCGCAMYTNAMALAAFDKAVEYANQRVQFDQPIAEFQGLRWKLADMAKRLEASRTLAYRAAISAQSRGRVPDRLDASIAKLLAGETAEYVVSEALQVHGANGYQQGHPLEYLYRLARGRRIAAGTDEIMRNNIAHVVVDDGVPWPDEY